MSAGETICPVVGIELYTGLCGIDFHATARFGLYDFGRKGQFAGFVLVQNEAVVVASTVLNLLVVGIYHIAHRMRGAEVERCAFYLQNLACGNAVLVDGNIEVSVNLADVVHCRRGRVGNTGQ